MEIGEKSGNEIGNEIGYENNAMYMSPLYIR
jgi:hypothetical protein